VSSRALPGGPVGTLRAGANPEQKQAVSRLWDGGGRVMLVRSLRASAGRHCWKRAGARPMEALQDTTL
jgi:hypothetical protein